MKKITFIITSLLLIVSILVTSTGCNQKVTAESLMEGISPNPVTPLEDLKSDAYIITDFGLKIFKQGYIDGENTLISPLSVLTALGMTSNGAKDNTLAQMEKLFGMSKDELNKYLYTYLNSLSESEKYKLKPANSIWFTSDERFSVKKDFLQTNADYYNADIYKTEFNDIAVKDINNWVKNKTNKMIPNIIEDVSDETVMYLINALAFEAEWADIYEKDQVEHGEFTLENGNKQTVEFMYSNENKYLENENSKGFIKYYSGHKYAFVALLPNEEISMSDYIQTLNGEELNKLLSNPKNNTVKTAIPKFKTEYETEMKDIMKALGMTDAFSGDTADFTNLGISTFGNIYIDKIIHKTYISVGEKGTKAGATTVIEMTNECAQIENNPKTVHLDRPFVYMLIDCQTNIPFFIGTMMEIND